MFSSSFDSAVLAKHWDIVISNPPYVSPRAFDTIISPSVRKFEPKLALVPDLIHLGPSTIKPSRDVDVGDAFYSRLLEVAARAGTQIAIFEISDMEQAKRIVAKAMATGKCQYMVIWRDQPDQKSAQSQTVEVLGRRVPIMGEGHARSVVFYKESASEWILSTP